ncbi:MAG: N-acetylmuramoyl-L-alanine amidase [Ruminococcaceae bacterium]|nr:N-acetylmuramoyl-L-alanine amidase [Oscillospiraceae bacterium]
MFYVINKKSIILTFSLMFVFIMSSFIYNSYQKSMVTSVTSNVIVIDPGHGGEDGGAVGVTGIKEKDLNLKIALKLKEKLLNSGINVVMTRDTDIMLCDKNQQKKRKRTDFDNRIKIAQNYNNAIFISIHMNYFEDNSQSGAQIFYSKNNPESKEIASILREELKNSLNPNNKRQIKPSGKEIYLLSNLKIPACLIECGFISNPTEEQLLMSDKYQEKIAETIKNGLLKYFS